MRNIFKKILIFLPFALTMGAMPVHAFTITGSSAAVKQEVVVQRQLLAEHTMSLTNRYAVPSVNNVFRDNILLNLAYLAGTVKNPKDINWEKLHKPFTYELTLQPGEVFAFHEDLLPEFTGKKVVTTNAKFNAAQGFLSDGYLYGDGVCHFASLINWVATDAGLRVVSLVNHDFARIPDIDRKFGTSIYSGDPRQNLYVENTFDKPVRLVFSSSKEAVTLKIYK